MSDQVIMAAGCMLHQLPKLLDQFGAIDQTQIRMTFGPSGSLRKKIENGENCSLFISAVSKHTDALLKTGKLCQSGVLGLNPTVLVCRSDLEISTETVLQFLTDPQWALGVSTTGLDPDADEVEILSKLSKTTDLNLERLIGRTRLITGGRENPNAPTGRNQYGWIMETQDLDLLLTFQSNAMEAVADNPDLKFIQVPSSIRVVGHFGVGISFDAIAAIQKFYHWILSEKGQKTLVQYGFRGIKGNHSSEPRRGQ
jgi:molybdate transport system substrate-binding protein